MGATTTTMSSAIASVFQPGLTRTFVEGTPLLRLLGWPFKPSMGGNSIDWKIQYAGHTASYVTEGDAYPAAGNNTYADATIAMQLIADSIQISGHAMDAMKGGYFDGVAAEMNDGVIAVLNKVEDYCIAQLEASIDDDSSYAGLTRATYGMAADVTAGSSGALTLALLSEMYETPKLAAAKVIYVPGDDIIVSAPEQVTAYTELGGLIVTGDTEAAGANLPYTQGSNEDVFDLGKLKHTIRYNNLPWYEVPGITNTLILRFKLSQVVTELFRPLTITPLGKVDDTDKFAVTCNVAMAYKDPGRASLIEALTT